jgi:hypothetical protein
LHPIHCRVLRKHEVTILASVTFWKTYLRRASMTINTIRSKSFSGGARWSTRPRSWKSAGPFSVANPGRTVLYGKKPLAKNATPTSWNTEQTVTRMHNSRVFIRPRIPSRQGSVKVKPTEVETKASLLWIGKGYFREGGIPSLNPRFLPSKPSLKLFEPLVRLSIVPSTRDKHLQKVSHRRML